MCLSQFLQDEITSHRHATTKNNVTKVTTTSTCKMKELGGLSLNEVQPKPHFIKLRERFPCI